MTQASIIVLGTLAMIEAASGHQTQTLQRILRSFKSNLTIDFRFIDTTCELRPRLNLSVDKSFALFCVRTMQASKIIARFSILIQDLTRSYRLFMLCKSLKKSV